MPKLFVLSGPDAGRRFDVAEGTVLGRGVDCAVHLRDASVSRHHARIERDGEGWKIVDTESRNGVLLRGERRESAALRDGDEFQIGEVQLRFRLEGAGSGREPEGEDRPELRVIPGAGRGGSIAEPDEITLEEDPLAELPRDVHAARSLRADVEATASFGSMIPTVRKPPDTVVQRGPRVLQYHRIPDREGFFGSDLAQQPLWVKLGAGLLAIAVFGAIFLVAFKGTSFLKARASGDPAELPVEETR